MSQNPTEQPDRSNEGYVEDPETGECRINGRVLNEEERLMVSRYRSEIYMLLHNASKEMKKREAAKKRQNAKAYKERMKRREEKKRARAARRKNR